MGSHEQHHLKVSGKNLGITIALNSIITIAQLVGGFISGSLALISDATHNFTDVLSLILSYIANKLSVNRAQTKNYTFGYKRAEIMAAFVNALTLIIIAVILAVEAVERLQNPQIIGSDLVIWMAVLGIVVNGFSVLLLKQDSKSNLNIRSAYIHLLTDMLTSVAVLAGGLLMKYYEVYWVDAILTLLISGYLICISYDVLIKSVKILMLFAPDAIEIQKVVDEIEKIETIKNVHHVHIWQLNEHDTHFDAHIQFNKDISLHDFDAICEQIEVLLKEKFQINHCYLQPEFDRDDEKEIIIQD